ncbi:MAG: N-carbamoyl-D-amino-acid hydrolase [Alphaproteobacteria bacterium]|nr:N-carbamoyl-D-amino-acid hydrolase [Alphaproteobacteria bacterium]MBU0797675.1 N-carbamoyl-D-amino-acid hydrolase [Alphaproteobacteria bacterium]MBU0887992.1 N-carbamoyl-D-amino-acid hydrolase [Alphaproteobacteria bacterium]MBU1811669.1 N-carbamoyl-D-amino-acid hydrolase [Alphaproteobacteria bacterium]
MTRILTSAAAQLGPIARNETRASAVARMIDLMKRGKERGVRYMVFPELALTTFFPRWYMEDWKEVETFFEKQMPTKDVLPLFEKAAEWGIGFYLGYAELTEDGHHYNTSILVNDKGRIVGKYRKVHLPGHSEYEAQRPWQHLEKRYFEPGDLGYPVWRSMGAIHGMAICNDRRWPEMYRSMGLQGVEIISLGYNTPDENTAAAEPKHLRNFHNDLVVQSGAYQNSCYVIATAKAGIEEGVGLIGGSLIAQPSGEIVAKAQTLGDELVVADLDLDLTVMGKQTIFNFANHRRVEHYARITGQTGVELPPEGDLEGEDVLSGK